MAAKRGDRVAPPGRPDGWEARFATSEVAKGWEELCRAARVVAAGPAHPKTTE